MTHGDRRKAQILDAGLQLWRQDASNVTARSIGKLLGLTHTAILYHYGSSNALKDSVANHAVAVRDAIVVPMLIASRHPAVAQMAEAEKVQYLTRL